MRQLATAWPSCRPWLSCLGSPKGSPRKVYLELEEDAGAEYEMYLAEKLHKTLGEIDAMPNAEFVRWNVYHARKAQMEELELAAKRGR